jgi:hypothetical protein
MLPERPMSLHHQPPTAMYSPTNCQLGREPSRHDPRTLRLRSYVSPRIAPAPPECFWDRAIREWGVMGNNRYGNCVIVTAAHLLMTWRANELGQTDAVPDDEVIELSRQMGALNGYNILDRNKLWRSRGMFGNKIWAFAQIDPRDALEIRHAVYDFGAADIGLNLPTAWRDNPDWETGKGPAFRPGSWGGHSVPIIAYDAQWCYCVTWGEMQRLSWEALAVYSDEAYALIDPVWLAKAGRTPANLDLERLHADLKELTN